MDNSLPFIENLQCPRHFLVYVSFTYFIIQDEVLSSYFSNEKHVSREAQQPVKPNATPQTRANSCI